MAKSWGTKGDIAATVALALLLLLLFVPKNWLLWVDRHWTTIKFLLLECFHSSSSCCRGPSEDWASVWLYCYIWVPLLENLCWHKSVCWNILWVVCKTARMLFTNSQCTQHIPSYKHNSLQQNHHPIVAFRTILNQMSPNTCLRWHTESLCLISGLCRSCQVFLFFFFNIPWERLFFLVLSWCRCALWWDSPPNRQENMCVGLPVPH